MKEEDFGQNSNHNVNPNESIKLYIKRNRRRLPNATNIHICFNGASGLCWRKAVIARMAWRKLPFKRESKADRNVAEELKKPQ